LAQIQRQDQGIVVFETIALVFLFFLLLCPFESVLLESVFNRSFSFLIFLSSSARLCDVPSPPLPTFPPPLFSLQGTAHFLEGDCLDVALWLRNNRKVNPLVVVSVDPR
jgi:hypothetical protein